MFLDSLNFDRKAHYILDSRVPVFTIPVSLLNLQSMPLDWNVTAISTRIPDKWCYLLWGSVTTTGHPDCMRNVIYQQPMRQSLKLFYRELKGLGHSAFRGTGTLGYHR